MGIIKSKVETLSELFKQNKELNLTLIQELKSYKQITALGGNQTQISKHKQKGKLLVNERIQKLIDPNSTFLELSELAAWNMYDNQTASAGIKTGIGTISNVRCMIIANDATVKGGTYFPMTVKKHLRAQEIAEQNNLPCIYLVDSGGAYLPLQSEVYPDKDHFGKIFFNQSRMSAQGLSQIAVVMGSCTAGGAYIPSMSDETVIVKNQGTIFLAGPPLVKAATGEKISSEDLGGGTLHTKESGVADYLAKDDEDAIKITREIMRHQTHLSKFGNKRTPQYNQKHFKEPEYDIQELLGIIPPSTQTPIDSKEIIARLVDESDFHEFKPLYDKSIICGFASIHGYEIGIIANNGILFSKSALKATHFIQLCDKRNIPLLFLQNITGFMVGKQVEKEGIAKHGAKMVTAVATTKVPKFTIITGGSYGAGNYAMCGRAYEPKFLFTWPNSRISVMGGQQAAQVLSQIKKDQIAPKRLSPTEIKAIEDPILKKYEEEGSPYYSTARLWDDGIINPCDTRKILGFCLETCQYSKDSHDNGFGLFRN